MYSWLVFEPNWIKWQPFICQFVWTPALFIILWCTRIISFPNYIFIIVVNFIPLNLMFSMIYDILYLRFVSILCFMFSYLFELSLLMLWCSFHPTHQRDLLLKAHTFASRALFDTNCIFHSWCILHSYISILRINVNKYPNIF